ncbi:MAG: hypothetical protein IIZ12_07070 [Eggerthellaceae bacterium]|nr:hypothetical protein [Eggerthellaceae bacterium]
MSNATKCDRCGECYEYGGMTVGEEYEICDGCVADFVAWMHGEMSHDTEHEAAQRIQVLEREIATLKEHRAANMEKLHELTDANAELRKYRDEWKGLAEKYRADSIAAQEETERYRAKLGDVLGALHEAERAAR